MGESLTQFCTGTRALTLFIILFLQFMMDLKNNNICFLFYFRKHIHQFFKTAIHIANVFSLVLHLKLALNFVTLPNPSDVTDC